MQPRDEEVAADSCRVAAPPHEHSVSVAEVVKGVPLLRGRLLALLAVLVTSFDTPTYRVLRLSLPQDSPSFGFAVALWGGWIGGVGCLALCLHTDGSWAALVEHIRELGAKHIALGTSLLGSSILVFTLALAQTTAANVLVLLALSCVRHFPLSCHKRPVLSCPTPTYAWQRRPLVTALLGRAVLGPPPLSAHTWAACVAGLVATVLVFYGSLDLGPSKVRRIKNPSKFFYFFYFFQESVQSDAARCSCWVPAWPHCTLFFIPPSRYNAPPSQPYVFLRSEFSLGPSFPSPPPSRWWRPAVQAWRQPRLPRRWMCSFCSRTAFCRRLPPCCLRAPCAPVPPRSCRFSACWKRLSAPSWCVDTREKGLSIHAECTGVRDCKRTARDAGRCRGRADARRSGGPYNL